jgi:4-amino-4-deoxy-L-arabinose transferase-like glycosyltransferase
MSAITTGPRQPAAAGRSRPDRLPGLLRGPAADPRWARPALLALLVLTAMLYAAGLSRNGWANDFYSAAVQAGAKSWKAFFFGSFDSSSFITVDKTPASLWVMELSARAFGLNSWSVLLPQAAEGVASVAILYAAVRRWSGPAAGLIAAAVLAVTPVATLMFRFNNPDALLVLLMTAAAYAMVRAIGSGRTRWIVLAGALLGFGFLTKMLQAFLVLPAFALVYLVAGPPRLGRRLWQLVAGGAALLVAAGWWVAIVQLTPAADRPYIGGSTTNSVLQLALGYNGLGRLTGNETGSVGFNGGASPGGGGGGSAFGGSTGLSRLFASDMGGQISWLLPAALIALAALVWLSWGRPRIDQVRAAALLWGGWLVVTGLVFSYMSGIIHPYYTVALAPAIGALTGIGAVTAWRTRRSMATGRALAARAVLAAGLVVTAWWASVLLGRSADWLPWLRPVILVCGLAAAAIVIAGRWVSGRAMVLSVAPLALVAGLAGPLAYSLDTAATSHTGALPSAGPSVASFGGPGGGGGFGGGGPGARFGSQGGTTQGGATQGGTTQGGAAQSGTGQPGAGAPGSSGVPGSAGAAGGTVGVPGGTSSRSSGSTAGRVPGSASGQSGRVPGGQGGGIGGGLGGNTQVSSAVTKLLTSGAAGYRWVAATVGAESAAPFQLASGEPIMAIGGFNGTDQAPTLAQFKKMVAAHEVHYFIGVNGHTFGGGSGDAAQITSWVQSHFTKQTVGGETIYNLTTPTST